MKKNRFLQMFCLLLAAVLLLLSVSCKKRITIDETDLLKSYFGESENAKPLKAGEAENITLPDDFQEKTAQFAFSLLNQTVRTLEPGKNQLLSPLSALYCLALIINGAGEETRAQMSAVLGMAPEELNPALLAYALGLPDTQDAKMKLANSIWFRNTGELQINDSFLKTVADWYAAQAYASKFDEKTVRNINAWCEKHTDGMIKEIIEEAEPSSMLYLINALVFDAKWETEYEKIQIQKGEFTAANGKKEAVTFLHSAESVYLNGKTFEGVAKFYKGGDYAFVGLLPKEGSDVATLAGTLTGEEWISVWENKSWEPVKTKIPEFKTESFTLLTDILKEMGMTDAFNPGAADFLPMGTFNGGSLYLSDVYQKTYLELDRNGTKAAAITWGDMKATSAAPPEDPKEIYLDRPFVYMIVDVQNGLPSFIGLAQTMINK